MMSRSIIFAALFIVSPRASSSHDHSKDEALRYQGDCMYRFLQYDKRNLVPQSRNFCSFHETTCEDGIIVGLRLDGTSRFTTFDLSWMPNTVKNFHAQDRFLDRMHYDTRHMPRQMEKFTISKSNLTGSVSLLDLPEGLKHLTLSYNRITGTVNLLALPERLEYLNLAGNKITHVLVAESRLPKTLLSIVLRRNDCKLELYDGEIDNRFQVDSK